MLLINLFLILLSNGLTIRKDVSILYSRLGVLVLIYSIISIYDVYYITYIEKGLGLYNGLFNATAITLTFQSFILIASLIILCLTSFYLRKTCGILNENEKNFFSRIKLITNKMAEQYTIIEYALIILFVIMGATLLLSSGDNISIFLSLELQSYGLYILCAIYRNSESSTSSGLTYFLLGGLSSCFILLGIAFIYVNSGVSCLDSFYVLTNLTTSPYFSSSFYNFQYITFSLLILSVGLLFKIGAAPFHFWTPDVYDGIPTIATTFVANMAKISILILMLELVHYTSETIKKTTFDWTTGIILSCLISLIIGTVVGLTQTRIKRLLAYSTVSHIGFILLALAVNTLESSKAFIFYLMQYTMSNINAFIILIAIGVSLYLYLEEKTKDTQGGKIQDKTTDSNLKETDNSPIQIINQLKGYFYINPLLSFCFGIVMLSFIGLPPLIGFFAKQMVLSSALDNGFIFIVLISVITSVIGAVYYLGIIKTMSFEKNDFKNFKTNIVVFISSNLSIIISIITLLILLFILIANVPIYLSNILSMLSFSDNINHDDLFFLIKVTIDTDHNIKLEFPDNWGQTATDTALNAETEKQATSSIYPKLNNDLDSGWITELTTRFKSMAEEPKDIIRYKPCLGYTPHIKPYSFIIFDLVQKWLESLPNLDVSDVWNTASNKFSSFSKLFEKNYLDAIDPSNLNNDIIVYTLPDVIANPARLPVNTIVQIYQWQASGNFEAVINYIFELVQNQRLDEFIAYIHEVEEIFAEEPEIWTLLVEAALGINETNPELISLFTLALHNEASVTVLQLVLNILIDDMPEEGRGVLETMVNTMINSATELIDQVNTSAEDTFRAFASLLFENNLNLELLSVRRGMGNSEGFFEFLFPSDTGNNMRVLSEYIQRIDHLVTFLVTISEVPQDEPIIGQLRELIEGSIVVEPHIHWFSTQALENIYQGVIDENYERIIVTEQEMEDWEVFYSYLRSFFEENFR